jgi:hypothetical protein
VVFRDSHQILDCSDTRIVQEGQLRRVLCDVFMQCSDGERANTRCRHGTLRLCGLVRGLRAGRSTGTPLRVEIERLWRPARISVYVNREGCGIFGGGRRFPLTRVLLARHVLVAFLFHHQMELAS